MPSYRRPGCNAAMRTQVVHDSDNYKSALSEGKALAVVVLALPGYSDRKRVATDSPNPLRQSPARCRRRTGSAPHRVVPGSLPPQCSTLGLARGSCSFEPPTPGRVLPWPPITPAAPFSLYHGGGLGGAGSDSNGGDAAFRGSFRPQRRGLRPLRERCCGSQDRRHVSPPPPRRRVGANHPGPAHEGEPRTPGPAVPSRPGGPGGTVRTFLLGD